MAGEMTTCIVCGHDFHTGTCGIEEDFGDHLERCDCDVEVVISAYTDDARAET